MNTTSFPLRNGGHILVDALVIHGVKKIFCVPGESFLPILDALSEVPFQMEVIVCRHEASAAHMAQAYARLTGLPGVCLVTRGPGVTQASIGLHTAAQDSTPLIMLVGQIDSQHTGREAWQELDMVQVFQSMVKRVAQIDRIERIPEIISSVFHACVSGRPGPCLVSLPEDLLYAKAQIADLGPYQKTSTQAPRAQIQALEVMLQEATQPLLILGGSNWDATSLSQMQSFVQEFEIPVCTGFRRQDLFDNTHPLYAGPLGPGMSAQLSKRIQQADLILAIGSRLSDTNTASYQLIQAPRAKQRLVHVHPDSQELGRVYQAELLIQSSLVEFAQSVSRLRASSQLPWRDHATEAHAQYLQTLTPTQVPGEVNLGRIVQWLNHHLPIDAIITNGAGNYTSWVHRFYQHQRLGTQLAPTSGTMGYGIPAAIAAKVTYPQRTVVCFAGDGCFMMSEKELATAKQLGLSIVFIVVNNHMYGSIRMHQERNFPGKVFATHLENPDFVILAKAYGMEGFLVTRTEEFERAFTLALQAKSGAIIELRTDPQAITPQMSIDDIRKLAASSS